MKVQKEKSLRGRISADEPNPVDIHVGHRIRLRRTLLGYSQQYMAGLLGLTFQQLQKYEKGFNRVGASRLYDISKVLKVSMDFFFEDMDENVQNQSPMMLKHSADEAPQWLMEEADTPDMDPMHRKEAIELVRAYYRISNRKVAKSLYDLIVSISKTASTSSDEE